MLRITDVAEKFHGTGLILKSWYLFRRSNYPALISPCWQNKTIKGLPEHEVSL